MVERKRERERKGGGGWGGGVGEQLHSTLFTEVTRTLRSTV